MPIANISEVWIERIYTPSVIHMSVGGCTVKQAMYRCYHRLISWLATFRYCQMCWFLVNPYYTCTKNLFLQISENSLKFQCKIHTFVIPNKIFRKVYLFLRDTVVTEGVPVIPHRPHLYHVICISTESPETARTSQNLAWDKESCL